MRVLTEKNVNLHLSAHTLFLQANYSNGAGMDRDTRIQHLKNNIKQDTELEHSLSPARSNQTLYIMFQSFISFMTAEVEDKNAWRKQLSPACGRYVSGVRCDRSGVRVGYGCGGRSYTKGSDYKPTD